MTSNSIDYRQDVERLMTDLEQRLAELKSGKINVWEQSSDNVSGRNITQQIIDRHERSLDVYRRLLQR